MMQKAIIPYKSVSLKTGSKGCLHCLEDTKDEKEDFCCLGCKSAYQIINKLGFSKYYNWRHLNNKEQSLKPEDLAIDIAEFAVKKNDGYFLNLMVQGLHCAACVWLIESILKKQKEVIAARINLSQKTLFLQWKGDVKIGNNLIKLINDIGYKLLPFDAKILQKSQEQYDDKILKALAVAGFGAGNLMLLSISLWFSDSFDMGAQTKNLLQFFSALIAVPIVIFSGRIFFISAYKSIKAGHANMDLPISLAIVLACITSIFQTIKNANHVYFDSAVMLIFFLLIGRYLDLKMRKKAFAIATEFTLISASFGRVLQDNKIITLPINKLQKDMILLVAAGEKIAADGVVISGVSEVDMSIINGETLPKKIIENSEVFAGTINIGAPIKVKITKAQNESLLAKIVELSCANENKKNNYVRLADKLAKFYTPTVHILAALTFSFWFFSGFENALLNATAVLIITCPCALALAVPLVQTITISRFIKQGILVKSGEALEKLPQAQIVVFDKTGSLTIGAPQFLQIKRIDGAEINEEEENYYLKIAASLACKSQHPLAKAIEKFYAKEVFEMEVSEKQGFGLAAKFNEKEVKMGRSEFCEIKNNFFTDQLKTFLKIGEMEFILLFSDQVKSDANQVISSLQAAGKKVILLSGDSKNIVEKLANELGILEFYFEKTPIEKTEILQNLKRQNKKFIMVGDGINDAPALALSDISISFSNASNIAQNIADIVICQNKLQPILQLIFSSKKSLKLMKENFAIALIYNLIAVPFAAFGFITPLISAISMSCSSLIVLLNSLRAAKN